MSACKANDGPTTRMLIDLRSFEKRTAMAKIAAIPIIPCANRSKFSLQILSAMNTRRLTRFAS